MLNYFLNVMSADVQRVLHFFLLNTKNHIMPYLVEFAIEVRCNTGHVFFCATYKKILVF